MSFLTLQGYASWNSQLWFIEEDGMMKFGLINLLIQRHFLIFFLWLSQDSRTRGHNLQLSRHFSSKRQRAHFLTNRVANLWDKLMPDTLAVQTTDSFKNCLDNEWSKKELKYNWEALRISNIKPLVSGMNLETKVCPRKVFWSNYLHSFSL